MSAAMSEAILVLEYTTGLFYLLYKKTLLVLLWRHLFLEQYTGKPILTLPL